MKHAKLSASGSHRWMNCAGSVKAESQLPSSTTVFAEEGSCAHEVGELALSSGSHATYYIGQLFHHTPVTLEMANHVQTYIDYVQALIEPTSTVFIEERVDFSDYVPEGFGTADAIVITGDHLHCIDLKYGKGVPVYPDNNSQGMLYALGSLRTTIKTVTIHIVQPRLFNYSEWTITAKELLHWGSTTARKSAVLALTDDAPRTASDKACQFCKAKATCSALFELTSSVIGDQFDNLDLDMTARQTKLVLDNKSLIDKFLKAVEAKATTDLVMGKPVDGYKLVAGRRIRKWTEDAEQLLVNELGDDAYIKKIIGLGEATKRVGKEFVDEHTYSSDPKPVIVKEDDKRDALDHVGFELLN